MPNRILRDWTDSDEVNRLTAEEERMFVRLIMVADDFGCFYGDPRRIRAACFPFNEEINSEMVRGWIATLTRALIRSYSANGQDYIEIVNFNQRLRAMRRKFPNPNPESKNPESESRIERNALAGQMTVMRKSDDRQMTVMRQSAERPSLDEVKAYAAQIGLGPWKAEDWFNEMEACGWLDFNHRPVAKWQPMLVRVKTKWEADGRPTAPPSAKASQSPNGAQRGPFYKETPSEADLLVRKFKREGLIPKDL